jgi:hypothetical protein
MAPNTGLAASLHVFGRVRSRPCLPVRTARALPAPPARDRRHYHRAGLKEFIVCDTDLWASCIGGAASSTRLPRITKSLKPFILPPGVCRTRRNAGHVVGSDFSRTLPLSTATKIRNPAGRQHLDLVCWRSRRWSPSGAGSTYSYEIARLGCTPRRVLRTSAAWGCARRMPMTCSARRGSCMPSSGLEDFHRHLTRADRWSSSAGYAL